MDRETANLRLIDHPLIRQKMCFLRDRSTESLNFRLLVGEIAGLMVYEVTRNLPLKERTVETPLEKTTGHILARPVTLVPILRAGLEMCEGILKLIPRARVGHIGLYRDHATLEPVRYYQKLPSDLSRSEIFIVDPMLATGGSAAAAIDYVKEAGGKSIHFISGLSPFFTEREKTRVVYPKSQRTRELWVPSLIFSKYRPSRQQSHNSGKRQFHKISLPLSILYRLILPT
jgi:uracil phosphoribosyltransferase